jgi:ABC-2 type transport system ATP-binding protein
MIQVEQLTKRYGEVNAIEDVTFEVSRGEVVGFLGPNGAGKSTTMRILTGCIGATSGRALIGGKDVLNDPRAVKRRIGYSPETPPVYGNMTVEDYVAFAAQLHGVQNIATAVTDALRRVNLLEVRHRIIENLSKGNRQRVGLAQALVHNPEVLILDEPTSGLDPAQRREIRELLMELARGERTVILSTHVLAEIEAVCQRVVIINRGKVVATDRIDTLSGSGGRVRLRLARPDEAASARLSAIAGVRSVTPEADGAWLITTDSDLREQIAAAAVPAGLLELSNAQRLEDIYIRLTTERSA